MYQQKKTSPTRESLWMRKHINDKFFGLQLECQLPITVTDVGQRRETHRGGVFSEKKNSSPLDASRLSVIAVLFIKVILMIGSIL